MRHPDRRTARDRVRLATTGLAVSSAVGVAGVAGGLALHDHLALSASWTSTSTGDRPSGPATGSGDDNTGPTQKVHRHHDAQHRPDNGSGRDGGLSRSSGSSQARSSGS